MPAKPALPLPRPGDSWPAWAPPPAAPRAAESPWIIRGDYVRLAPGSDLWRRHDDLRSALGQVLAATWRSGRTRILTVAFDGDVRLVEVPGDGFALA